jgi:O-antigen/teichoic acid export membrane protein
MKELGRWQVISFISRSVAMAIGLVQGFVIAAILTKAEWGITQLAVSIGGALGIYQHLGLASASTREISSAKKEEDVFKIFVTSVVIRYCVTLPIAIGLFFSSHYLANVLYKNAFLELPLKIYAVTLLFQGVQSIFNSVVSGTKRFKQLFIYQAVIAIVSVVLYIPLVYFYRIQGYFYAFFIFNIISSISLSYLAFKPLKGKIVFPGKKEFMTLLKEIFSISLAIYLMKIIYTNWEKLGSNALGLFESPEVIATYAFALLYAKKLTSISDSVTDVNLPVLSEKYVKDISGFKILFEKNFNKLFSFIVLIGTFAAYWAPFIVQLAVGHKYDDSFVLIPPLVFCFVLYSLMNIINASVLIPAKMTKSMITSFIALIAGTGIFFYLTRFQLGVLGSMAWGMAFGSLVALIFMLFFIKRVIKFNFINIDHVAILFAGFIVSMLCPIQNFWLKAVGFVFIAPLLIWSVFIPSFLEKQDLGYAFSGFKKVIDLITRRKV